MFRQGDMIFFKVVELFYAAPLESKGENINVVEDRVDEFLRKADGKISRERDPQYCNHGKSGMCSHCMPLEPYDSGYQAAKGIKNLSFHAYLRKLASTNTSGSKLIEEADFKVKIPCIGRHPAYPEGICTKCQPSAIILNPQTFRMVDHVEIDDPQVVDGFLAGWRRTGFQRFGWLLGRYDVYEGVPLGIKAVVNAIYEPPQDGSVDGFQLLDDTYSGSAQEVAQDLGLSVIGMIYTDLSDDGSHTGKVVHRRSKDTFFVSSAEALFMAQNQLIRPSPCKDSSTGQFSSKFITVIVTGNEKNEIDFNAYQVSNIAEAMVSAKIIEATTDPSLIMVKHSIPKQHYVPEVMYKLNDEYGNVVQRKADPFFPVDFLLITLSHGFPVKPDPFFRSPFSFPPLVDRPTINGAFKTYMEQVENMPMSVSLSNFNLLLFLHEQDIIDKAQVKSICQAVRSRDEEELLRLTLSSPSWATLVTLSKEASVASSSNATSSDRIPKDWTCPHCTFINCDRVEDTCEMCGLPSA